MLEVKQIKSGVVIDHISAGNGLKIFNKLKLNKTDNSVVLLMNVESKLLGKKDIIKIENTHDLDVDLLGLIDDNITITYIENSEVVRKRKVFIPKKVKGLIKCTNPRCITNSDSYIEPSFTLLSEKSLEYNCSYCDEITKYKL